MFNFLFYKSPLEIAAENGNEKVVSILDDNLDEYKEEEEFEEESETYGNLCMTRIYK